MQGKVSYSKSVSETDTRGAGERGQQEAEQRTREKQEKNKKEKVNQEIVFFPIFKLNQTKSIGCFS